MSVKMLIIIKDEKKMFQLKVNTLRLHYNAVLYNADSIITRSPHGSQIFFQYKCVKISADDSGIHNASCENRTPCVFPSQVWHQLISPRGDVNGHSIYNAYVIITVMGDHSLCENYFQTTGQSDL